MADLSIISNIIDNCVVSVISFQFLFILLLISVGIISVAIISGIILSIIIVLNVLTSAVCGPAEPEAGHVHADLKLKVIESVCL